MKAYTSRAGAPQYKQSIETLMDVVEGDNSTGFCLACGEPNHGIEPDMRKGRCEHCGAPKVYGAEQLILMGLFYHEGN